MYPAGCAGRDASADFRAMNSLRAASSAPKNLLWRGRERRGWRLCHWSRRRRNGSHSRFGFFACSNAHNSKGKAKSLYYFHEKW